MTRAISLVLLLVIGLGLVAGSLAWTVDRRRAIETAELVTGGNVDRGEAALFAYGCVGCHSIPGVRLARGKVHLRMRLAEKTKGGNVIDFPKTGTRA